jgi:nucleoside-triphosphatase THEP1
VKNILIRGKKSSGKTFLVHRIVADFENSVKIAGLFTKKHESGIVTIQEWDNFTVFEDGPSAIVIDLNEGCVRKQAFEKTGVETLERAMQKSSLIIMDELGRFELECTRFIETVYRAFDSRIPVLATIKDEKNPFLISLTRRKDTTLVIIDERTRANVHEEVHSILKSCLFPE